MVASMRRMEPTAASGPLAARAAHLAAIPQSAHSCRYRPNARPNATSILASASRIAAAKAGRP